MKNAIQYSIVPKDLAGHLFEVTLTVPSPDPEGQVVALPAWIPGSYMIREFARNIVRIHAESEGKKVALKKLDKHTWKAEPCSEGAGMGANAPLMLRYEVYAWDLSVRAAHLDQTHGFFNGTSVFLRVAGQEQRPHVVDIRRADDAVCKSWRIATALPELKAKRYGFGTYFAADYDELIDHPVEMGNFELATFKAYGVPHDIVITGQAPNLDMARLTNDLKKICEAHIAFFEPETLQAPMKRYVFMTMVVGEGYGGLEHRASTALICSRADLPVQSKKQSKEQQGKEQQSKEHQEMSNEYRAYLGLCSHEYFHTWNVKRIKPAVFAPYDLNEETYTSLLWLFEGFTSYYDDLMLVRSGVIDETAYFKLLAKTINGVLRGNGRHKQSVAESSFDAWIKYYRQDENSPNAIVSYYTKGALIAAALDLTIRTGTKGKKSLDDVMRVLWQRFGRDFYAKNMPEQQGIEEEEAEALFDEATGLALRRFFERYVCGVEDLPLAKLFKPFGIDYADQRRQDKPSLDVRVARDGNDCKLATVYEGGAAHRAGLSANDVLIAVDGLRVSAGNLDAALSRYRVGDAVILHAFRRDELMMFNATLAADTESRVMLTAQPKPVAAARMRAAWLGTK